MAEFTVYRGEDKLVEITITDKLGVAIDLATVDGIQAYIKNGKIILAQFSLNAEAGFEALTVSDAANGKFQVRLQSAKTISARLGVYSVENKIERTDAAYLNSTKHDVAIIVDLIEIKNSVSRTDIDLST